MSEQTIGRDGELAALTSFLDEVPAGPCALVLEGEPGIGKTTLWKEGVAAATARDYRVLSARPVQSEARLSYTSLEDILEPVLEESLGLLPEPQRSALEIALLRKAAVGSRPDARAVSAAALGTLGLRRRRSL